MSDKPFSFIFAGTSEDPSGIVRSCRIRITTPRALSADEYRCVVRSNVPALDGHPSHGASRRQALHLARRLVASLLAGWGWILRDARGRRVRIGEPFEVTAPMPGRRGGRAIVASLKRTARGRQLELREVALDKKGEPSGRARAYLTMRVRVRRDGSVEATSAEQLGQEIVTRLVIADRVATRHRRDGRKR